MSLLDKLFRFLFRTNEYEVVAWARTNDRGDLFDLRLQNNPHIDQSTIVPLYRVK
jgi:hypothetical protein